MTMSSSGCLMKKHLSLLLALAASLATVGACGSPHPRFPEATSSLRTELGGEPDVVVVIHGARLRQDPVHAALMACRRNAGQMTPQESEVFSNLDELSIAYRVDVARNTHRGVVVARGHFEGTMFQRLGLDVRPGASPGEYRLGYDLFGRRGGEVVAVPISGGFAF